MKKISVLIVTYNSANVIEKCLDSILAYVPIQDLEIVIVDNHSKDHTLEILQNFGSQIILIRNSTNVGFSRAMNQAYRASSAPYVMTFNPDAELYQDTLGKVMECFEQYPKAGMVAGILSDENQTYALPHKTLHLFEESITFHTASKYFPTVLKSLQKTPYTYDCEWVIGTCMTVKRSLLPEQQMYPENSFLFWEEYDLCHNIVNTGAKILVCKGVRYKHETSTSFKYDPAKLSMAVKLSNAHAYRIKRQSFGLFKTKIALIYTVLDKLIFYSILKAKNVISKSCNIERERSMLESKVIAKLYLQLLWGGLKKVQQIDAQAVLFFNK